ncbi:hypothetical protein Bhyg_17595 [Pseudolycoriella hygida]|uniref:CHK kinase-like domain-containing protein n=1 Tax=Pseudolycoriella hygida TaxID=35572 RepID=A0A9Q0RU22_9DIPT|nr:hypothetical protein Bhyg_17595 [Pseudolycoriella hygida]
MLNKSISVKDCRDILLKATNIDPNVNDVCYEVNLIDDSFGYIADLARLAISVGEQNDEISSKKFMFVAKLVPLDSNGEIRRSDLNWMFDREAFMYSEILLKIKEAANWYPKCYLARENLLVLEDLNLSGFKHLVHRTRLDRPLVECVLRSVAAMHADSIAFEVKIHPKTVREVFGAYKAEFAITPEMKWFQMGLEAVKRIIPISRNYHRYSSKYSNKLFDELVFPVYEMVKPSKKYRNVFCHQDLWAGNIMFKFQKTNGEDNLNEPISCVFMDFQFPRYLPPVADVLMFILMSTRLENRREYLMSYYKYYYDCLRMELEKQELNPDDVLTWHDFQSSCNELKLFPLVFNCVALPFTFYPKDIQVKMKNCTDAEFQRVRDVGHYDFMLQYMKEDDEFKDVILESIEELMEELFD